MNFHQRYINGEDGLLIYSEIYSLGANAFDIEYYADIENVLKETFNRVAYNLTIIFDELRNVGYVFKTNAQFNFEKPLLAPLANTNELLKKLDKSVADFGYVPLSLKLFYEIVGSCNFAWDYNRVPKILWPCADPIQITSLNDLVAEISDESWAEYLAEMIEDDPDQAAYIQLSADYFHKDNISGGEPYSIQITNQNCIDSLFLNEPHKTTFINYLRICMANCGFSRITDEHRKNGYQAFYEKVKPQLKNI